MNFTVVGAGAVGGFVGGLLKKDGHDVTFIARGRHLEAMQSEGLTIEQDDRSFTINDTFTNDVDSVKYADVILVTVKSTETTEIIKQIIPHVKKEAYILTLQNGVSNEEEISQHFGRKKVISGASHLSAKVVQPGNIRQEGSFLFILGPLNENATIMTKDIVNYFNHAGIHCKFSTDILNKKWEKALWNVTFNPLSAVSRATVGEILDDKNLKATAEAAYVEIETLYKASGFKLKEGAKQKVFANAELVRNHKTSMLQDLERGKPLEYEALCGYYVKKAQNLHIDVPTLQTMYSILSFIDKRRVLE